MSALLEMYIKIEKNLYEKKYIYDILYTRVEKI